MAFIHTVTTIDISSNKRKQGKVMPIMSVQSLKPLIHSTSWVVGGGASLDSGLASSLASSLPDNDSLLGVEMLDEAILKSVGSGMILNLILNLNWTLRKLLTDQRILQIRRPLAQYKKGERLWWPGFVHRNPNSDHPISSLFDGGCYTSLKRLLSALNRHDDKNFHRLWSTRLHHEHLLLDCS
jgi:hypothetical protein